MNKKRLCRVFALFGIIFLATGVKANAYDCNYKNTGTDNYGSATGNQSSGNNGNGGSGGSKPRYVYKAPTQNGSYEHPYKSYYSDYAISEANRDFPSFYNNNSNASSVFETGYVESPTPTYHMQNDGTCLVTYQQWYSPKIIANVTTTPKNATMLDVLDHYVWWRSGIEPLAEFNSSSSVYDFTPTAVGQTSVHCYGVRRHVEGYWQDKNGNVVLSYADGHTTNALSKSDSKLNYREVTTYPNMQRQDWNFNISPAEVGHVISTDYYKPVSDTNKNVEAWADTQLIN